MPATERSWTRAEVLDLIARNPLCTPRYELVDGVLLVTPAPGNTHQRAVKWMCWLLTNFLIEQPGVAEAFTSPADVRLEPETTVGPDVFVVPIGEARRMLREPSVHALLLAVEVLSPGDRSGDRSRKRKLYQRTIPEYWIVDIPARAIEVWRAGSAMPTVQTAAFEWRPTGAAAPLVLDVAAYFRRVHGDDL
jgi:Uma2 family endonuclease